MLALFVAIGILNVCLGFGLAMYFGFGPPGIDGILQSLGPMPAAAPSPADSTPVGLGALYIPGSDETAGQSDADPITASTPIESHDAQSEENVLSDVHALTAAARTALVPAVPSQQ